MTKLEEKSIDDVVRSLVSERFDGITIVDVNIEEDVDFDGNPILRVSVVYDAKDDTSAGRSFAGLLRNLRPALHGRGEERFPVMSFVDSSEVGVLPGAA
ncbi:hypothetical protein AAD018_000025 [Aestuariibius insulae]|uniref:hypothetical protein n=1 Tax=Aestuariibius insulae TaxID=2058287 RepID=UPI00345EDB3C